MKKRRTLQLGLLLALLFVQGFWVRAAVFPTWTKEYSEKKTTENIDNLTKIDPAQMLAALAGFREMIAGILWVRADAFFDEGNYDAILPIIRLVTILDPKQIDVYATGMWHIGYNFTDEESRSDRRYIPSALALGAEGARANDYTYELFFETGWIWYHKIDDDYEKAVDWFEQANDKIDIQPARRNLLGMAYQRAGKIDRAREYYYELLQEAQEVFDNDSRFHNLQNRDTLEQNHDNLLVRMAMRGHWAREGGFIDEFQYDTEPPFDVGFSAKVTVEEPKVITVEGTWNVRPVGTRVRFILRDKNMEFAKPAGMEWDSDERVELDPPKDVTFLQELLFVKNRRFTKRIDMSRDPTMYPFVQDDYVIEFYYNPRSSPPHMQDKFGFNGHGLTDKNYLNTDVREGQRVIFAQLEISRDQILRRGTWEIGRDTPSMQTKGYVERTASENKIGLIKLPGQLGEGVKPEEPTLLQSETHGAGPGPVSD